MTTEVVFGYRHINWPGFKNCPCNDPGNYVAFEVRDGVDTIVCWCGRTTKVNSWDSPKERADFIAAHQYAGET
jgi:hypothetical protein